MHATLLEPLKAPKVSIVLNNYNYGRFLEQALQSAVAQTIQCEVIVVDDGSTDDSIEILKAWKDRVCVILQENSGQIGACTSGFLASSGDVLLFLDSDDILEPNAAELVAAQFTEGVAKVHFKLRLMDEDGLVTGSTIPRVLARGDVLSPLVQHGLLYASAPGSGNAYRRDVLARLFPLPIDAKDKHGADFFMVYGSAAYGRVAAIDMPLARYRVHGSIASSQSLAFGNAQRKAGSSDRFSRRLDRFRVWIVERTKGRVQPPARFLDFSNQKSDFAGAVLNGESVGVRLRKGSSQFLWLMKALWLRREDSFFNKLTLSLWAVAVLALPRAFAMPLAQYACDPARRS